LIAVNAAPLLAILMLAAVCFMSTQKAPILILEGSKQPYLSIGRHYGGVKAWGYEYLYIQPQDAFLRKDYVKQYNKHKKAGHSWESFIEFVKSVK